MTPRVSVIVRSYNRLVALGELVAALLRQTYPSFEIVVVEQSTVRPPEAVRRLEELAVDARVRLVHRPPRGGAAARNEGAAAARGEILLFIDDDDLPGDDAWIARHAAAYEDPACLGMSGRQLFEDEASPAGGVLAAFYTRTLSFSPLLRLPLAYVRHDRRRVPVGAIHGTNASVRRSAVARFGGWDTDTAIEDEASFNLRVARGKRPEEYFAYDPRALLRRRRDLAGGLDKRQMTARRFFTRYMDFVHRIVARYHPARVIALYPLYILAVYALAVGWICAESRRYPSWPRRLAALASLLAMAPLLALASAVDTLAARRELLPTSSAVDPRSARL